VQTDKNVSRQTKKAISYNEGVKTLVETGALGEQIAAKFLKKKGYRIIEQNHREKWGELDIIAKSPDKTLVFVEVKTMSGPGHSGLRPEDHLTTRKLAQLRKLSAFYANARLGLVDPRKGWRIDLVALTTSDDYCVVSHYENIG
jgi:putative endonuclease